MNRMIKTKEPNSIYAKTQIEAAHENEPRLAVPSCHGGDDITNTQPWTK